MIEPEFKSFLRSIVETLEQLGVIYGIGGSVASSIDGEARSTHDVDISVILPLEQVLAFTQAFEALGYYVFLDAILDAIIVRQPFNIIDAKRGYKADFFPVDPDHRPLRNVKSCSGVGLESRCFQRRRGSAVLPRRCDCL